VGRDGDDAGELFREAVRGATPLHDRRRVPISGPARAGQRRAKPARDDGTAKLHVDEAGGRAFGVSRKTMRELAAGALPLQATLDLHRHTSREAYERLTRFLAESRATGLRSILVITGKGRAEEPAGMASRERLRDLVPAWLSGQLASRVLAFTPARAEHGGAGALYVLLRTSP